MHKSIKSNKEFKKSLTLILLSMLLAMSLVCSLEFATALSPYTGVIRITAEGTVEGTDKIQRNGNVYTLNGDISGSVGDGATFISIERDGVVFDGAGKTIRGINAGVAIGIRGRSDITIKNLRIVDFGTGIELYTHSLDSNSTASNNRIIDNYFETKYWAIDLRGVKGTVSGNTFVSQKRIYGVSFWTNETSFTDNAFINGGLTFMNSGVSNVFSGNTIDGKPLVILEGQSNQIIDGANQVVLINCKDMVVKNIDSTGLRQPVMLFGTTSTKITNCKTSSILLTNSHSNTLIGNELTETAFMGGHGTASVKLLSSHNNTISGNSLTGNGCYGIILSGSGYNKIEKNSIASTSPDRAGIQLESGCENNYIYENNITAEAYGIYLQTGAEHNVFFKNSITNCKDSIVMSGSMFNDFLGNTFSGSSRYAVNLAGSDGNNFVWNSFVGNTQVYEDHSTYWMSFTNGSYYAAYTKWDNGVEGNYWSGYTGADADGDGIGETSYHVYENFTDHYPLTKPFNTDKIQIDFKEWVPQTPENTQLPHQNPPTSSSPENDQPSDSFPVVPAAAAVGTAVFLASSILLWYFKRVPKTRLT